MKFFLFPKWIFPSQNHPSSQRAIIKTLASELKLELLFGCSKPASLHSWKFNAISHMQCTHSNCYRYLFSSSFWLHLIVGCCYLDPSVLFCGYRVRIYLIFINSHTDVANEKFTKIFQRFVLCYFVLWMYLIFMVLGPDFSEPNWPSLVWLCLWRRKRTK